MFFNKKFFLILIIISFSSQQSFASLKNSIKKNLKNIDNFTFNFEQNINDKKEKGKCIVEYPKKIYCTYNLKNKKKIISNGRSLVIKTTDSFYIYPLEKTPLNYILDKEFLLRKIQTLNERIIDNKFVNYKFYEYNNEINIFFDIKSFNLIGWQTQDIYQNLSITYINSILINQKLKKNQFKLPSRN